MQYKPSKRASVCYASEWTNRKCTLLFLYQIEWWIYWFSSHSSSISLGLCVWLLCLASCLFLSIEWKWCAFKNAISVINFLHESPCKCIRKRKNMNRAAASRKIHSLALYLAFCFILLFFSTSSVFFFSFRLYSVCIAVVQRKSVLMVCLQMRTRSLNCNLNIAAMHKWKVCVGVHNFSYNRTCAFFFFIFLLSLFFACFVQIKNTTSRNQR